MVLQKIWGFHIHPSDSVGINKNKYENNTFNIPPKVKYIKLRFIFKVMVKHCQFTQVLGFSSDTQIKSQKVKEIRLLKDVIILHIRIYENPL